MTEERIAEVFEQSGLAEIARKSKNDELLNGLQSAMIKIANDDPLKEFEMELKHLATMFYKKSGAKCVDINIRISSYEESHKIGLEFYGNENRDCQKVNGCCQG